MKMFQILTHNNKGAMEDEVSEFILAGWFPYGPVLVNQKENHKEYIVTVMRMKPGATKEVKPTIH